MKAFLSAVAVAACMSCGAETLVLKSGETEVVIGADASRATQIAAEELSGLLGQVFGTGVPVVPAPTAGKKAITLDGGATDLPRDAFRIAVTAEGIRIEGRDSRERNPESIVKLPGEMEWGPQFERATLFGVYEFLERVAGCRFYFPGELGTIVPRARELKIPCGRISKAPVFTVRRYGYSDGKVPDEILAEFGGDWKKVKKLNFYRLRMETEYFQCCHGLKKFRILQRFGETHPEYFCLGKDGKRMNRKGEYRAGLLCFSSAVTNVIYEDIKAYLQGRPVQERYPIKGMRRWPLAFQNNVIDVMSQDDMTPCQCAGCQAVYDKNAGSNYATEQIWGFTRDLARRLNADGFSDYKLTQMAYHPYKAIPKDPLPTNVHVMVAVQGPWSVRSEKGYRRQAEIVRGWKRTLGHKVWLWTYPGKAMSLHIPGPPTVSPRAWGEFYKREADDIYGAFSESETENWLHNYLNYYVFSRVAWNPSVDVDAVLAEHHRLMFGAAANEMQALYDRFEDAWAGGVAANVVDTPAGPVASVPSEGRLWRKVYSEEFMAGCAKLLDAAAAKVSAGSPEARRIALIRREYYEPLVKVRGEAIRQLDKDEGKPRYAQGHPKSDGKPFSLRPTNWHGGKIIRDQMANTFVTVARKGDDLVFTWDCRETRNADAVTKVTARDRPEMERDDSVELYLDVTGDRSVYYRFIVNRAGMLADACGVKPRTRSGTKWKYDWESKAKVKVATTAFGWTCELRLPLASFPDYDKRIVANFCRNRVLRGEPEVTPHFYWGPQYNYEDLRRFTTLIIED